MELKNEKQLVKIVDIGSGDAFFDVKKAFIGMVGEFSLFFTKKDGYKSGKFQPLDKRVSPIPFFLVKLEPITRNNVISAPETYEFHTELNHVVKGKVIMQNNATVVILSDGSKGVAHCGKDCTFDVEKGKEIAILRALSAHYAKRAKEVGNG